MIWTCLGYSRNFENFDYFWVAKSKIMIRTRVRVRIQIRIRVRIRVRDMITIGVWINVLITVRIRVRIRVRNNGSSTHVTRLKIASNRTTNMANPISIMHDTNLKKKDYERN